MEDTIRWSQVIASKQKKPDQKILIFAIVLLIIQSCNSRSPEDDAKYVFEVGSNVEKKIETLLSSSIPKNFDSPPIVSMIKLIQMQVMKSKFYSENQENKKLELALNEMYKYYNALLKRMISFVEEEGAIPGAKENQ